MHDFQKEAICNTLRKAEGLDCLHGHGYYIDDYQVEDKQVWSYHLLVSDTVARTLIAEAINQSGPEMYPENRKDLPPPMASWMLPANKEFVIFDSNAKYVFGIYKHDFRTFIIRAEGRVLRGYELKRLKETAIKAGGLHQVPYLDALVTLFP